MGLEDALGDVVGKAMRGNNLSAESLSDKCGLTTTQIRQILEYQLVPANAELRTLAEVLKLNPEGLIQVAHDSYSPQAPGLEGWQNLAYWSSAYEDFNVNAFIVWDKRSKEAVLFDTGTSMDAIRRIVQDNKLTISILALTHTHGDHIAVLDEVRREYAPQIVGSSREPVAPATYGEPVAPATYGEPVAPATYGAPVAPATYGAPVAPATYGAPVAPATYGAPVAPATYLVDGETLEVGSLKLVVRETDGHSPGGLTFVVSSADASPNLAVVGDAIFAGSVGGAMVSYENLLRNIRTRILSLPDDTLVLPGHGPITTVGQEKLHNPFSPT